MLQHWDSLESTVLHPTEDQKDDHCCNGESFVVVNFGIVQAGFAMVSGDVVGDVRSQVWVVVVGTDRAHTRDAHDSGGYWCWKMRECPLGECPRLVEYLCQSVQVSKQQYR